MTSCLFVEIPTVSADILQLLKHRGPVILLPGQQVVLTQAGALPLSHSSLALNYQLGERVSFYSKLDLIDGTLEYNMCMF